MKRKGFTLVEMIAVTVIIAVMASIVVGRLQNERAGIQFIKGIQSIESAANKARNQAIVTGRTQELTFDNTSQSLKVGVAEDAQETSPINTRSTETETPEPADANIGSGWSVSQITGSDGNSESDLSIKFFADGTAEAKSVEFKSGDALVSLYVSRDGKIEVKREAMVEKNNQEWEAGNLEQRLGE